MEMNFHHPYQPYDIQKQFMTALYDCVEQRKVGIFESPTGTGKSLSLICGSLTWLREHKRRTFEEGLAADALDEDEPEWMLEHARKEKRRAALQQRAELEERLANVRAKERKLKERYENGEPLFKRQRTKMDNADPRDDDEARFLLDDYESDEDAKGTGGLRNGRESGFSAETEALMKKLGMPVGKTDAEENAEEVDEPKVFYCSRTHSQLSQFAGELRRVKMPPAISSSEGQPMRSGQKDDADTEITENFRHLTLGSRKNLCINPKVQKLGSASLVNEKCLDLQKPGTAADRKCPYLPTKETEPIVNDFRDHTLADIRDIEDLGKIGKKLGVCPYYASRAAVKPSEIVTLPYPLLLQKTAREALDINMKGHVVIIDEAHNLMDAITGIYSVSVSLSQLLRSRGQLTTYLQRFRNKLKGKNRVYLAQTVRLVDSLIRYLQSIDSNAGEEEGIVQIGDLMAGKGVDQINLYKLLRYLDESRLARKVDGYVLHTEEQEKSKQSTPAMSGEPRSTMPVLMHIQSFFYALLNPSVEGRFFYAKNDEELGLCLKYMLLDPTHHFRDIVEDARAVILAGGTMSPMSDYSEHLLSYLPPSRIMTVSCGHVIPPSNLLAWPVKTGPSGAPFDFTFEKRNTEATILDLGSAILSFISSIPDGVVVFFPSYAYLDRCIEAWQRLPSPRGASGAKTLYYALTLVKPTFHESKSKATRMEKTTTAPPEQINVTTDSVLSAYSTAVATGNGRGALLLAVIGGSLSEGINFSDGLGRGVVVVGLPFPNPHSAEWKAKLAYISRKAVEKGGSGDAGKAAAREFYENACMRAVNQCVGRAIRHRNDYASILLVDRRYESDRIKGKLPGWIRGSLRKGDGVQVVKRGLVEFFAGKTWAVKDKYGEE